MTATTDPERAPWIRRKTHRKNSTVVWGEYALGGFTEAKLRDHMAGLADELHALFTHHRPDLPRRSSLSCGGVYGAWLHCPNPIADEVVRRVQLRHNVFLSHHYDERELLRAATRPHANPEPPRQPPVPIDTEFDALLVAIANNDVERYRLLREDRFPVW